MDRQLNYPKTQDLPYELTHDTIARQVFDKASTEARTRRKVERFIRENYEAHRERGAKLTRDDLDYVTPYLGIVNINEEERAFIEKGRTALKQARRNLRLLVIAIMAALLGLTAWALTKSRQASNNQARALANAERAHNNAAEALLAKQQDSLRAIDLGIALDAADAAKRADSLKAIELGLALNEANLQRLAAERKTREAEALALAATARSLPKEELHIAIRLAQKAYERTDVPTPIAAQTLANLFYSQYGVTTPTATLIPEATFLHQDSLDRIIQVGYSPDGDLVATLSYTGRLTLWDTNGRVHAVIQNYEGYNQQFLFSSDGQYLAIYGFGAKLYDLSGQFIREFLPETRINAAAFSPDNTRLIMGQNNGRLAQAKVDVGDVYEFDLHSSDILCLAYHPSPGPILVTGGGEDGTGSLWSRGGQIVGPIGKRQPSDPREEGHEAPIRSIAFSPNGNNILTTSEDGTAKLWHRTGGNSATMDQHSDFVVSGKFSPDGQRIITASYDHTAKIWDLEGRLLHSLEGHKAKLRSAEFSPDGRFILTTSDDETAKLWHSDGRFHATLDNDIFYPELSRRSGNMPHAVFSPDGQSVLLADGGHLASQWSVDGALLERFVHDDQIFDAAFSPDGKYILTGSDDYTAKLWSTQGNELMTIDSHEDALFSVDFASNNTDFLTSSRDATFGLWNTNGESLLFQESRLDEIRVIRFSPDGEHILTATRNGGLALWDRSGNPLFAHYQHTTFIREASFSPDGAFILTRTGDNTARIWTREGELVAVLSRDFEFSQVLYAAFSPDGKYVLTCETDQARIWNLAGELLHILPAGRVRFSKDGQFLIGLQNQQVNVWLPSSRLVAQYSAQLAPGESLIDVSPNDHQLLTAFRDNRTNLFGMRIRSLQGELLADFREHSKAINGAQFSPDGRHVLTYAEDGTAKLWPTPPTIYEWLRDEAPIPELTRRQREMYGLE